jgi:hypothetical protein
VLRILQEETWGGKNGVVDQVKDIGEWGQHETPSLRDVKEQTVRDFAEVLYYTDEL